MRNASLEDRKKYLLNTMDYLHDFCVKNNIKYYIFAGTLLGAVRHKGYIPWDDDIDVALPREDYDRLLEMFDQSDASFRIIDYKKDKRYYLPYAKFSNKNTELYELVRKPINLGINIDLFPLDHLTENKETALRLYQKIKRYRTINNILNESVRSKNVFKSVIRLAVHLIPQKLVLNKIDKLSRQYNEMPSKYTGVISAITKPGEIMEEDFFKERVLLEFEGRKYFAPAKYEKVLEYNFGNWKELPPVEKRVAHHLNDAFIKD